MLLPIELDEEVAKVCGAEGREEAVDVGVTSCRACDDLGGRSEAPPPPLLAISRNPCPCGTLENNLA